MSVSLGGRKGLSHPFLIRKPSIFFPFLGASTIHLRPLLHGLPKSPLNRQPLRARRGSVQRRGRPAQAAAAERRRVLVSARSRSQSFTNGDADVGTTWQYQYFTLKGDGDRSPRPRPQEGFLPQEGATGWSDTWMISIAKQRTKLHLPVDEPRDLSGGQRKSRSCSARRRPREGRARSSRTLDPAYFGAPDHCELYNADNPEFWKRVYYWNTPLADCGDDRGNVCMDYNDWVSAWTEIKG